MARKLAVAVALIAAKSDVADARVEDLLNYFPTRYEDRSNFIGIDKLYDGLVASVEVYTRVSGAFQVGKNRSPKAPKLFIFEISGGDRERTQKPIVVWWFVSGKQANHVINYYKERFQRGTRFVAFGRWEWDARRNTFALKLNKPDELEMLPPLEQTEPLGFPAEDSAQISNTLPDDSENELLEDVDYPESHGAQRPHGSDLPKTRPVSNQTHSRDHFCSFEGVGPLLCHGESAA